MPGFRNLQAAYNPKKRVWKSKKLYAVEEDEDGFQILKVYNVHWE